MGREQKAEDPVIKIDREGNWFYNSLPIINKKIYLFFNQNLKIDARGNYIIQVGNEICPIEVEDTPFVVKDVSAVQTGSPGRFFFKISLNDETEEELDLNTFHIGKDNIPYCRVKKGGFPARFLRAPYYELARYIQEENSGFYILLKDEKVQVRFD